MADGPRLPLYLNDTPCASNRRTPETWADPSDAPPLAAPPSILDEAARIVHGSRQSDYGHPIDNWTLTADLFTAALRSKLREGEVITSETAVLLMELVKVARELHRPKRDNRTDLAGYAEVLDMIVTERQRREEG